MKPEKKLRSEVAELYRNQWWVRCLLASEHDQLGLILRAAMAIPSKEPPWLGPSAIIDQDGTVLANYVDERNKMKFAAIVGHIDDVLGNLRELANVLQLPTHEAEALFASVRAWIKSDARPDTEQAEDRVPADQRDR